ncbi:hypothetical protein GCM10027184_25720 [Saccharothrix stipae]
MQRVRDVDVPNGLVLRLEDAAPPPGGRPRPADRRTEQLGIFTHGHAVPLNPEGTSSDPTWPAIRDYLVNHYDGDGDDPFWGENVWYRIDPSWMVAYSTDPAGLLDNNPCSLMPASAPSGFVVVPRMCT